ncbi:putative integral membrane protein [Neofusicoccum parvum]|nr:putative integral membrane protein [Neofusicoccum parvum]
MALQARQMVLAIEQLNSTSTCLTKISILFFYRRLARGPYTSKFVRVVQANIIFVAAYLLVFSVVLFLTCYPFQAYWLQFDIVWVQQNTYRCLNEAATTVVANAISILQDFIACGLPSVLLWKLQMRKKQKVLLACLLGLGILPCLAGVLRLVYTVRLYSTYDSTWAAYPVLAWTVVETHLGILCASAPALHSYAKEASRSQAWSSTLNLFKSLSDRSYRRSTSGGRRSHGYSASGHIELSEHGGSAASKGAARRGGVLPDSKNISQSDTLLSSTLNGTDFSRSFVTKDGEDARDLERGAVVPPQQAFEEQRRRDGGTWYLDTMPEISPIRLPDGVPAAYLGPQARSPPTARGPLREEDDDGEGEIGVAMTAAPVTVVPLDIRRNRD